MKWLAVLGLWCVAVVTMRAADEAYEKEIEAARADRAARLTAADGWLTLIGMHFLKDGTNTVGSAKDNDVVLAAGPARLGRVMLSTEGKVNVEFAPDADVRVDGRKVQAAELAYGVESRASVVTCGTISFFVIDRSGKKALRVRDSASERRAKFGGIDYFPTDAAWRIEARWVPFEEPRATPISNILGQVSPAFVIGKAVFERDGQKIELLPIEDGSGGPLFFVISDLTSGKETYAAARFVYAEQPENGKVVIDFNRAQNPPCAFTPFAICPLPPKENRLPFAVSAGEKDYRGGHE